MSIFSDNPPSTNAEQNQRLGYKYPTQFLMPPYLQANPYYTDYADSIDEVFDDLVYSKFEVLKNIRNVWIGNPELENKILDNEVLQHSDWTIDEWQTLIKKCNLLGLKITQAGSIPAAAYLAISRFLGQYWREKGKEAAIDFISFCLGVDLELIQLWTEDYRAFYSKEDNVIGTPVWEGGTWYPTSHVAIRANTGLPAHIDIQELASLFNDISNYNLVLWSIDNNYQHYIGTWDSDRTKIIAVAAYCNNSLIVSNVNRYGAKPPKLNVFDWVTTQFYASQTVGNNVGYYLGQAYGWLLYEGDKKIPIYSPDFQEVQLAESIPTRVYGDGEILCGNIVGWAPVPGSSWSTARIPVYMKDNPPPPNAGVEGVIWNTGKPDLVEAGHHIEFVGNVLDKIPTFIGIFRYLKGVHTRRYIGVSPIPISSPRGFVELYEGQFAPYWDKDD